MARIHQLTIHCGIFIVLALSSLGMGSMLNILRDHPMGVYYQTPAQRLLDRNSIEESRWVDNEENRTEDETWIHEIKTTDEINPHTPMRQEIKIITIDELKTLSDQGSAVVFDVRPNLFYQIGHIPGSFSLQKKAFTIDFKAQKSRLDTAMEQGRDIVIYCAGPNCPDASKVAMKLQEMNYRNLSVFEGGWDEWERSDSPQESSL